MNWKALFDTLTINGKKPVFFDLKGYLIELVDWELKRLTGAEFKTVVVGEWPLAKATLPLVTIVRLGESADTRFIGETYAASTMAQRRAAEASHLAGEGPEPAAGQTTADPGEDVDAWLFDEVLELCVWSDNKEIADAMGRLVKAIVLASSHDMIAAADLQAFALVGGRDERGLDKESGRPIFWRPFNVTAVVPFKLVTPSEVVRTVRGRQRAST